MDRNSNIELKSGMITKRSQQMKSFSPTNFKERVFVLTSTKISYYEGNLEKRGKIKGSLKLEDITYVGELEDDALNRTSAFQIRHGNYYLYCCSKSLNDRENWINAIKQACVDAGQTLYTSYHPRIYSSGKWQCCFKSERNSSGCKEPTIPTSNYGNSLKPLPPVPTKELPPPPPPPARRIVEVTPRTQPEEYYISMYDFMPQEARDIRLKQGDKYKLIDSSQPNWWMVENCYGKRGYAPENYLTKHLGGSEDVFEGEKWFVGDCSRTDAESMLYKDNREGTFLVRNSKQAPGQHTLSILSRGGMVSGPPLVKHYRIQKTSTGLFYLAENHQMTTVCELINYHRHNSGGLVTRLRQPPIEYCGEDEVSALFTNPRWQINIDEIQLFKELGSGQFGVVKLGKIDNTLVAVKIMKEGTMEENAFVEEAQVMTNLDHPNLVKLYGVVTQTKPICIVTEFMEEGCLLDYVRSNRKLVQYPEILLGISHQICDAMRYLESRNVIHRDLAARNCLVGRHRCVKVADFGLSRFVLEDEYTSSAGAKFPIKWSAIEVLHYTKFSSKSDVWAFGILMWEIFSGGRTPYPAQNNMEVIDFIDHGKRLDRPERCPHDVYQMMLTMWRNDPNNRPTFVSLYEDIADIIDKFNTVAIEDFH